MKLFPILFIVACVSATAETVNFDSFTAAAPPPGWNIGLTGKGQSRWTVEQDPSAPSKPNVLKQSGEGTFPICIKEEPVSKDGFVEVKFKPISGKEDQAGGVIWRCQDKDNYYVARANALENNLTIYRTIKGKRVAFKNVNVPVKGNTWHALRVEFAGTKFTVALDGRQLIEATDDSLTEPGKIGLWTKADSVTLFDDFTFGTSTAK